MWTIIEELWQKKLTIISNSLVDGLDSLINVYLMRHYILCDYILENTIFFEPTMTNRQSAHLKACAHLYVRRSDQYEYFKSPKGTHPLAGNSKTLNKYGSVYPKLKGSGLPVFTVPVIVDYDGNRKVREEIKRTTGHIVSQGTKNTIKNYVISHIWGQTDKPDFFSFLWNICLIPNWEAFISDKNANSYRGTSTGNFIKTFQDTLKSIACTLYPSLVLGTLPSPLINVHGKQILMVNNDGIIFPHIIP